VVVPNANSSGDYDVIEVAEFLGRTNRLDYNILKTCEELAELQEVLLKYHLKTPDKKPDIQNIIDEIGDVAIRIMALTEALHVEENLNHRFQIKANKFMEYYKQGLYKGGI
jgi:NTP pyrophosphatase (non-canonical NTP hydrolase)